MATLQLVDCTDKELSEFKDGSSERNRELQERALVTAAQCGDADAFDALLRPHSQRNFRAIYRITKNREDAEDALQDAYLKAFVHIRAFDGRSRFSTWLTSIALNSAFAVVRKRNSKLAVHSESLGDALRAGFERVPDQAPNPESAYLEGERRGMIRHAIRALPPTIREALELQKIRELSLKKTAEILGVSVAAVKARLFRARVELRKALA